MERQDEDVARGSDIGLAMTALSAQMPDDRPLTIEKAEVRLFRVPPPLRLEDSTHHVSAIEIIILELTVDGRVGRGFSYTAGIGGTAIRALLQDYCCAELVGRDARLAVGSWMSIYRHLSRTGMGAITTLSLAAIDIALWELRCHEAKQPLYVKCRGWGALHPRLCQQHRHRPEPGRDLRSPRRAAESWLHLVQD